MATKIKVIKRDERNRRKAETPETEATKKTPQAAARDIVATVTEWVNEFQQRRRTDTTQAFKSLFTETAPQPSKA
jgi:hypothetical protein